MRLLARLATPLLALLPLSALAQEGPRDGWSLGLTVIRDTNPYIGQDSDLIPIPLISYRSGPFAIGTNGVSYRLLDRGAWQVRVAARPRFSGLISTDGPLLDGIDRRVTGDVALELGYDIGIFNAGIDFRQEFTGEHDGSEIRVGVGSRTQLGPVGLRFDAGAAWQNGDLSRYIWGVSNVEARPGRPAYDPGEVIVPFLGLSGRLPINDSWSVLATVRADFFPDEVADSPIIADDTLITTGVGVVFRF